MLKSLGESLRKNRILAWSQNVSSKLFINYKGRNVNFAMKKSGRENLTMQSRSTSSEISCIGIMFPQYYMLKEEKNQYLVVFLPKLHKLNLVISQEEMSDKFRLRHIHKISDHYSSKVSR